MKYLIDVSGGVDSVVLLHMLAGRGQDMVVAHFDHGARSDSAADARFVEALARQYDVPFVVKREELGAGVSEEMARSRRYAFLRHQAKEHAAVIVTAHHKTDVIETIAINIRRGTGWRGLAVLDAPDIVRPLLGVTKQEIREYALKHRLEWVEDYTNQSDNYLRNRIRARIGRDLPVRVSEKLVALWKRQREIKREIDTECNQLTEGQERYGRYFFIQIEAPVAVELLRFVLNMHAGHPPTRPQAEQALLAIKTAKAGAMHQVGDGVTLAFTRRFFVVKTP